MFRVLLSIGGPTVTLWPARKVQSKKGDNRLAELPLPIATPPRVLMQKLQSIWHQEPSMNWAKDQEPWATVVSTANSLSHLCIQSEKSPKPPGSNWDSVEKSEMGFWNRTQRTSNPPFSGEIQLFTLICQKTLRDPILPGRSHSLLLSFFFLRT